MLHGTPCSAFGRRPFDERGDEKEAKSITCTMMTRMQWSVIASQYRQASAPPYFIGRIDGNRLIGGGIDGFLDDVGPL